MLFDAYVPTRTHDSLEVRVRSSSSDPVALQLGDTRRVVEVPLVSHRGTHFFRHTFTELPSGTSWPLELRQGTDRASLEGSTLPRAPGPEKMRIGLLADLHLSTQQSSIDAYGTSTRRLYGLACELTARYVRRLEALGVDAIVLLGDVVDPCSDETLGLLRQTIDSIQVPVYAVIGNHEAWCPGGEVRFYCAFDLPAGGYYSVHRDGVRLVMLSTPEPDALDPSSPQRRWLEDELRAASPDEDILLFSHFSLLLHPCVQGAKNDGYQLLRGHRELLQLLHGFPRVRAFVAGHKNVPSLVVSSGVAHTLSPQLIQAPCGYDVLRLYEGGMARTTYEIDEQHYCEVARTAYGAQFPERYGTEDGRNFLHLYG